MQRKRQIEDTLVGSASMTQAKQRTHSRFEAMLTNACGSRQNYTHFMVHAVYLLDERKLPPPVISVEAAFAASVHGGAAAASSRSHPIPPSRPRYLDSGLRGSSSYNTFKLIIIIRVCALHGN